MPAKSKDAKRCVACTRPAIRRVGHVRCCERHARDALEKLIADGPQRKVDAGANRKKRNGCGALHFPSQLVAAVIQPEVDAIGVRNFAFRAKVPERTIHAILAGEREHVSLAVADDLITKGLGRPDLFQDEPLALYYRR